MIGYLDKLVSILPKMIGYFITFTFKDGDKDKNKKLMFFHIDDDNLLKKYKTIWTKIEDLKNIELNTLLVCNDKM